MASHQAKKAIELLQFKSNYISYIFPIFTVFRAETFEARQNTGSIHGVRMAGIYPTTCKIRTFFSYDPDTNSADFLQYV